MQQRSRVLVSSIVEATLQLLTRRDGADDPSVRSIADRAGVGVGSVYQYFSSREGVIDALVDRVTSDNFTAFEAVLEEHAESELEVLFDAIIERAMEAYVARPTLTRVAIRSIITFGRLSAITAERDRFARLLASRLRADMPRVAPEVLLASATVAADMAMGTLVSEVYRPSSPQRMKIIASAIRRQARGELAHLRSLEFADPTE